MKKKRNSKNIYDKYITLDNLYKMWLIIKRTCKNKVAVYYYSLNLNTNLMNIYTSLKNKTYTPSKYRTFMIFEPKPRLVMSQTITDKIVNHFVANYYLIPYLESCLIDSNVATRANKGSGYAMELLKKYFNKLLINYPNQEIYCLKMDISKYFYSINHDILLSMVSNKIADEDVINLIRIIISETNNDYVNDVVKMYNRKYGTDIPYYVEKTGLSIGAMSSQFFAIFYLNKVDHFIKEELKCKYYIRYMDDFLILDTDKDKLKYYYKCIEEKINELGLKLNNKSNIYRCSKGISFLGYTYKVINNKLHISCKKDTYFRIKKRLEYLNQTDICQYKKSLGSYNGYFKPVKIKETGGFQVSIKELYDSYKNKYNDCIIILKDKKLYQTRGLDAKIIWSIFHYKFYNGKVCFSPNSYDKVIFNLMNKNINFIVVSKTGEILSFINENNNYEKYSNIASSTYEKKQQEISIINRVKTSILKNPETLDKINDFLNSLEEEQRKKEEK